MTTAIDSVTFRPPILEDARACLELMTRRDVAEYGESDSDMDDLLYDWQTIDMQQDAWLAYTPQGDLVGYGVVLPVGAVYRYDFCADPTWEGPELGRALLARCEGRARSLLQVRGGQARVMTRTYLAHVNQQDAEIVKQAGFEAVKYHFQMYIDMKDVTAEPRWPAGITLRTVKPGEDDRSLHAFIQAAFERPGRTAQAFEDWKAFMMRPDTFKPDLWVLALEGEEIVGACLGFEYPEGGWVRQLGVSPAWRGKGLGAALLLNAFAEFKRRGFEQVGLVVESDNPTAMQFYQKVGMYCKRQYDEYVKWIEAGEA